MRNHNSKCDWCPPKCYPRFPPSFFVNPGRSEYPNPGNIEQLHSQTHGIMPKFFDGIEVTFHNALAPNKSIKMNWTLSHTRPSGFRIGGIYCTRRHNDILETPTVYADINPSSLSSNVRLIWYPWQSLCLGAVLQKSNALFHKIVTAEISSPSTTYTANLYNTTLEQGRGTVSFLRSVTSHLALGAELLIEWNGPRHMQSDTALAMKYTRNRYAMALTVSRQGFDVSYWQRIHPAIQMASSLAFNRNSQRAIASVCYQWEFKDTTVRGMVNSDMSVGFTYYRSLSHAPCAFGLSVLLCIPRDRFTFGIKIDLDPSINCG